MKLIKTILIALLLTIIGLLQLICLPIKLIHFLVYGPRNPEFVGYAWYSNKEYRKLINTSDDDINQMIPTYELWKEKADESVKDFTDSGSIVIKVNIQIKELKKWLHQNHLPNTVDNREKYVTAHVEPFLKDKTISLECMPLKAHQATRGTCIHLVPKG